MTRSMLCCVMLVFGAAPSLSAQRLDTHRASFQRAVAHHGKWLTAIGSVALIMFAQREHNRSNRDWDALLEMCRSAQDACALGANGRYVRSDAEQLYQRSRAFDRRANHWLFGAQASLLTTTALFIIDLHPGEGPDNIPYPPVKLGMRIPF